MKITLMCVAALPYEAADELPGVNGEVLNYRGKSYDLSQLPDGGEVEASEPFAGNVKRANGQIELSLQFKYDADLAEPDQSSNITNYTFIVTDGQCPDPIKYKPIQQEPENVN